MLSLSKSLSYSSLRCSTLLELKAEPVETAPRVRSTRRKTRSNAIRERMWGMQRSVLRSRLGRKDAILRHTSGESLREADEIVQRRVCEVKKHVLASRLGRV